MPGHDPVSRDRRALLSAGGALLLSAALVPGRAMAQANGGKSRIGVIGSGHIGGTIGGLWAKDGHEVLFSSRHPEELKDLVAGLGANAQAGTVQQAIDVRSTSSLSPCPMRRCRRSARIMARR